jgi:hypothetical protein
MKQGVIGARRSVVCILTGHELKDPNATVKYHTGIDMKSVQDLAPEIRAHRQARNRPIAVDDDLASIVKAMGGDPKLVDGMEMKVVKLPLPVASIDPVGATLVSPLGHIEKYGRHKCHPYAKTTMTITSHHRRPRDEWGQRLVALAKLDPSLNVLAAIDRPDSPVIARRRRRDRGRRKDRRAGHARPQAHADVLIDFTGAVVDEALAQDAAGIAASRMVIGTTGLARPTTPRSTRPPSTSRCFRRRT